MPTITAQQIIDRAQRTLFDETGVQYPTAELLEHLSDAQRACVIHLPEVNPIATVIRCAPGTRQSLPEDGFKLIDVVRNLGASASWSTNRAAQPDPYEHTVPTNAITSVEKSYLDKIDMGSWHMAGPDQPTRIRHFIYDTRDRRGFYVSPSQPASVANRQLIEIIYAASPPEIETAASVIAIDDIYQPPLLSYTLHRAHAKDIPASTNDPNRSVAYFQQFIMTLTGQKVDDERLHPRQMADLEKA